MLHNRKAKVEKKGLHVRLGTDLLDRFEIACISQGLTKTAAVSMLIEAWITENGIQAAMMEATMIAIGRTLEMSPATFEDVLPHSTIQ